MVDIGQVTWAVAAGKPDVMLLLLNKLMEDGNVLYKVNFIILFLNFWMPEKLAVIHLKFKEAIPEGILSKICKWNSKQ